MKTKLLKNEEDILFMLKHTLKRLHYINTSSMFLFFSWTRCASEIPVGHCPMTDAYLQP